MLAGCLQSDSLPSWQKVWNMTKVSNFRNSNKSQDIQNKAYLLFHRFSKKKQIFFKENKNCLQCNYYSSRKTTFRNIQGIKNRRSNYKLKMYHMKSEVWNERSCPTEDSPECWLFRVLDDHKPTQIRRENQHWKTTQVKSHFASEKISR